jgi:hypothetical protein
MKLIWKLNACVLLFCLSVSLCAETNIAVKNTLTNKIKVATLVNTKVEGTVANSAEITATNTAKNTIENTSNTVSTEKITTDAAATEKVASAATIAISATLTSANTATTSTSTSAAANAGAGATTAAASESKSTSSSLNTNENTVERKKHKHNIYAANDKMLSKFENEKKKFHAEKHHTFIEHTNTAKVENNKPSAAASGITFVHLKNTKITETKEWLAYRKCEIKKGFLEIIKLDNPIAKKIELVKGRVTLTPESMKLFTTMDEESLFVTINLESILKISQLSRFKDSGCFDIVLNKAYPSDKYLHKRRITLCAADKTKMGEWVHALFEFKECSMNHPAPKDSKIVLDFNEVNKIKKNDVDMWGLYYDNSKGVYQNKGMKNKELVLQHTVNKLISTIQMKNLEHAKVSRQLESKLKEAQQFSHEMEHKEEMIQHILHKKLEQQNKLDIQTAQDRAVGREVQLISAMAAKITDMKVNNISIKN